MENKPIIINKDIIQSYLMTTAKYDFSVYEKRILYKVIEMTQSALEGKELNVKYKINGTLFGDKIYTIPIKELLLHDEDKNHNRIKEALKSLQKKTYEFQNENGSWASINLIANPRINDYQTETSFLIDRLMFDVFMDFTKGFKKFELKTAMEFESVYAMRFYELMSGQKKPIEFKIETLKEMFSLSNKYKLTSNFFRRVIDIAKTELDLKSPYTFDYEPQKKGRAFHSIIFYPKYQPQFRDSELEKKDLQKQVSLSWDLPKNVVDYLKHNFEFTSDGIKNNIELLKLAHNRLDIISFLATLKGKVRESKNPQGYIIGALKKQLN